MSAKIVLEKGYDLKHGLGYKVVRFEGIKIVEELPTEYNYTTPCYCLDKPERISLHYDGTDGRLYEVYIDVNRFYTIENMERYLSHMVEAGLRLKEIMGKIQEEQIKNEWYGEVEVEL